MKLKPVYPDDITKGVDSQWRTNMLEIRKEALVEGFSGIEVCLDRTKDTNAEDLFSLKPEHVKASFEIIALADRVVVSCPKERAFVVLKDRHG